MLRCRNLTRPRNTEEIGRWEKKFIIHIVRFKVSTLRGWLFSKAENSVSLRVVGASVTYGASYEVVLDSLVVVPDSLLFCLTFSSRITDFFSTNVYSLDLLLLSSSEMLIGSFVTLIYASVDLWFWAFADAAGGKLNYLEELWRRCSIVWSSTRSSYVRRSSSFLKLRSKDSIFIINITTIKSVPCLLAG